MLISEIKEKIAPTLFRHNVRRAGLFGSFATGNDTLVSDIDLWVELKDKISLLEFVQIKLELKDVLERKVDLVEYQAIKPELKERIFAEEVQIYEYK